MYNTMPEVSMHVTYGGTYGAGLYTFPPDIYQNRNPHWATLFMIHVSVPLVLERWFIHPFTT
jgi:hypothetical protein